MPRSTHPARVFAVHYTQMLIAMGAGMLLLLPAWGLATRNLTAAWLARPEVSPLVMATAMAAGTAAWMRLRRHSWREVVQMSASIYAGYAVLLPLSWLGVLDGDAVMVLGHLLMLAAMAVPMLARPEAYAVPHQRRAPTRATP